MVLINLLIPCNLRPGTIVESRGKAPDVTWSLSLKAFRLFAVVSRGKASDVTWSLSLN